MKLSLVCFQTNQRCGLYSFYLDMCLLLLPNIYILSLLFFLWNNSCSKSLFSHLSGIVRLPLSPLLWYFIILSYLLEILDAVQSILQIGLHFDAIGYISRTWMQTWKVSIFKFFSIYRISFWIILWQSYFIPFPLLALLFSPSWVVPVYTIVLIFLLFIYVSLFLLLFSLAGFWESNPQLFQICSIRQVKHLI